MTRLVIFGAGSIGAMTAGYLDRAGVPLTLVDPWHLNVGAIRRDGLHVQRTGDDFVARPRALLVDELDLIDGPIDVLMIAMKSYDTEWVARLMVPSLAPDAVVISAQNGINEERIAGIVGRERVIGCAIPMSGFLDRPGHVVGYTTPVSGAYVLGELDGPVSDRVRRMAALLAPVGTIKTADDIGAAIWAKFLINVTTNALGGVTTMTTPQLWADRAMVTLMVALGGEAVQVARRMGQGIADITPPGLPAHLRFDPGSLADAHAGDAEAFENVVRCYAATSAARKGMTEGKVSLLQDLIRGRRTEVDHLNGYIASRGRALGVPCPANEAITALVHEVELGRAQPGPDAVLELLRAPVA